MMYQRSWWLIAVGSVVVVIYSAFLLAAAEDSLRKQKPPSDEAALRTRSTEVEEAAEQLYEAIRKAAEGHTVTEDVRQQIVDLQKVSGTDPSDVLREFYEERGGSVQERIIILRALQQVGTRQALAAIKQIAMKPGDSPQTLGPEAVKAFAALTSDPDQIGQLLDSDVPEVRDAAASALSNRKLTDATVRRLGELLRSDSWITHSQVAAAFLTDKSTATAPCKVDLILAALPRLEHLADAKRVLPRLGSTAREMALGQYIRTLAIMEGAEPILRQKRDRLTSESLEHKVVVLALALRGDKSVYPSVLQFAKDDKDALLRVLAIRGLGMIGSRQDINLLERIAETDSYSRPSASDRTNEAGKTVYPVRREAKRAIAQIRKRIVTPR